LQWIFMLKFIDSVAWRPFVSWLADTVCLTGIYSKSAVVQDLGQFGAGSGLVSCWIFKMVWFLWDCKCLDSPPPLQGGLGMQALVGEIDGLIVSITYVVVSVIFWLQLLCLCFRKSRLR